MPEQLGSFALQAVIQSALPDSCVTVLEQVGSTNQWLLDSQPSDRLDHFCLALTQSAGRGRRGKDWQSPVGHFYGSASLVVSLPPSALGPLSLAIACTVAEVLEGFGVAGIRLKWPNDIQIDGQKLAGILLELPPSAPNARSNTERVQRVVVGLGVNRVPLGESVGQSATSLTHALAGDAPPLDAMASCLWAAMRDCRSVFEDRGFAAFEAAWRERDCLSGQDVTVLQGETRWVGRADGVTSDGNLRVLTHDGSREVSAGEVSVRAA